MDKIEAQRILDAITGPCPCGCHTHGKLPFDHDRTEHWKCPCHPVNKMTAMLEPKSLKKSPDEITRQGH